MNIPTVTIGLPTFNRADLLRGVLNNLRSQTFEDLELLISDNASTDPRVRHVCEQAAAEDPRVRYFRQNENRGALSNFWFVWEQARSPYFMWASDDDIWPLNFVERAVAALIRNS